MGDLPSPAWPVLVLAGIQVADALLCIQPAVFIAQCLRDVRFPPRYWRLLPLVKLAAAAGLVLGIWVPYLGLLTCAALIAYFIVAISMHVRARDLGRNLFVNATGMLALCLAVSGLSFLP
jgi:DoxX-like protein